MPWSCRQVLLSHWGCQILPVLPDPFMVLLDYSLVEKRQINTAWQWGLQAAPVSLDIDWHWVSWRIIDLCSEEGPAHPVCKGRLAGTRIPLLTPGILTKFHAVKPQGPNFSPAALNEQMQSNGSFCTGRFLPLLQSIKPARCWQRLLDDRHKTDICMCLDSDIHEQTQSITLNILPDLFLHIQACYIIQPAHQMLSG